MSEPITDYYGDEVSFVSVSTILKDCTDSVDFGSVPEDPDANARWWQRVIQSKASDLGFSTLVNAILEFGFDPRSPVGWTGREITEGHHRIVAAILLGLDEIPYTRFGGGNGAICAHNCNCNGESDGGIQV